LVLARDLPVLREVAGNIPSVNFAQSDSEFLAKLENLLNMVRKSDEFYELSMRSIERSKVFSKDVILEKLKTQLLFIAHEKR
jgi:hypothetical protein